MSEMNHALSTFFTDGLNIDPVIDDSGQLVRLEFTADSLPGLRVTLLADAARALSVALSNVLSGLDTVVSD